MIRILPVSSFNTISDSSPGCRPTEIPVVDATVKVQQRERFAQRPAGACVDPLPPQTVMSAFMEVKYSVFPSGDQLAQSSGPTPTM